MIDLILLFFVFGVFYGGFWCGNKYHTLSAMKAAALAYFKAL